jgi:hypothetical protein
VRSATELAKRIWVRASACMLGDDRQLAMMRSQCGYVPNIFLPRSFNEKVIKRKLSPAPALWSVLADKVRVREYVSSVVGPEILNEVYLVTEDPEEIKFDRLPERFVVKANHGSHWTRIVRDKAQADEEQLRATCRGWLGRKYGLRTREAWYDVIPPRIVLERFLHDEDHGIPLDYKVWVFHGTARFVQVSTGRFHRVTHTVYDRYWRRQVWTRGTPGPDIPRPARLEELLAIAERLAGDIDFVRVDLYYVNERDIVFGEMTFAPQGGHGRFYPDKRYDFEVGALW